MRKNKMMRLASGLLVLTLLTTCMISGTFAKYVTEETGSDSARVAKWGWTEASVVLTDLFKPEAKADKAVSSNDEAIIAPGTEGSGTFGFTYGGEADIDAPEVAYTFAVGATGTCDEFIKANQNIKWYLDKDSSSTALTWDQLIAAIKELAGDPSGTKNYGPNQAPTAFNKDDFYQHTISWEWDFQGTDTATRYWVKDKTVATSEPDDSTDYTAMTQNEYDTYMGNMAELDDVSITVTVTATQID